MPQSLANQWFRPLENDSPVAQRGLRILRSLAKSAPRTVGKTVGPSLSQLPTVPGHNHQSVDDLRQDNVSGAADTFDWLHSATQDSAFVPTLQDICNLNFEDLAGMNFGDASFIGDTEWSQHPS